jgi:hypothetical protein
MVSGWELAGSLLRGPLRASAPWPFVAHALLCDLRPRFLVKAAVGPGHRAVARNCRVLLCSDRPPADLPGRVARLRLQTWHRVLLPGEAPEPYGVLLCVRCGDRPGARPAFVTRLAPQSAPGGELDLDLGGGLVLAFDAAQPGPVF